MTCMNGGEAMARLLKAAGTEYIFGIAVGSQSPLIMAAIQLGMGIVTVRDEKAAALAVLLIPLGPGERRLLIRIMTPFSIVFITVSIRDAVYHIMTPSLIAPLSL
jgi:Thiamine pyrophosphate enzyme, N-terminal TPP binding domain